jgi:hypothetical protein
MLQLLSHRICAEFKVLVVILEEFVPIDQMHDIDSTAAVNPQRLADTATGAGNVCGFSLQ